MRRGAMQLAAGVLAGAAMAGTAEAAIPGSDGKIHACRSGSATPLQVNVTGPFGLSVSVKLPAGSVRFIDKETSPPEACRAGESEVSWNQTGPAGPQGPQGPPGPPGSGGAGADDGATAVDFGSIPAGGTPVKVFSVAGFGDVVISRCTEDGQLAVNLRNTTDRPFGVGGPIELYGFDVQPGGSVGDYAGGELPGLGTNNIAADGFVAQKEFSGDDRVLSISEMLLTAGNGAGSDATKLTVYAISRAATDRCVVWGFTNG